MDANTNTSTAVSHPDVMQKILDRNPAVSIGVVMQFQELERQLNQLGVRLGSRYSLSHPLERIRDLSVPSPVFFNTSATNAD